MGERILREEGFEVVTVTDGLTALMRLADVDPDVVFADVSLPRKSGYDICRELKAHPRHKHVRVILTAGLLETFDDDEAAAVKCDGILKKPFEASMVMETLRPLVEAANKEREEYAPALAMLSSDVVPVKVVTDFSELAPPPASSTIDVERVRAAVTLAFDAALPAMIDRVTEQVLVALGH
jgi:CheY-like chemotaxis protein